MTHVGSEESLMDLRGCERRRMTREKVKTTCHSSDGAAPDAREGGVEPVLCERP